jgi:hypothetical protein
MPDEVIDAAVPTDQPPADFADYEKWADERAAAPKETDKPADAPAKADAPKTEPNSEADVDQEHDDDAETPQKKSGFARRIDKLNQKLGAKDARIAELERLTQGGNATRTPEQTPAKAAESGKPNIADFETYDQYVEQLTEWKVEQREQAREAKAAAAQAAQEAQARAKTWNERVAAAKAELTDFDDVMADADDIPATPAMIEAITSSDHGPAIAYHLAQNADEAKRIATLSPFAMAREIGKIEAAISAKATPETPKPRVTKAPAPPKTVRTQSETAEPDPTDFAAWERWRNAQPGASLRR